MTMSSEDNLGGWEKMTLLDEAPNTRQIRASRLRRMCFIWIGAMSFFAALTVLLAKTPGLLERRIDDFCYAREFSKEANVTLDVRYYSMDDKGDALWESVLTENQGFVFHQYRPKGSSEDEIRMWGISMFHQLHCLQMIRMALKPLAGNKTKIMAHEPHGPMSGDSKNHEPQHGGVDDSHWQHCLDYLRQSILCAADGTIEAPERDPEDPGADRIDGMGPKMCRDNSKLFELSSRSGLSKEARVKAMNAGNRWPEMQGIRYPSPKD